MEMKVQKAPNLIPIRPQEYIYKHSLGRLDRRENVYSKKDFVLLKSILTSVISVN